MSIWNNLSVEVAVKLHENLDNDEFDPTYQYLPQAMLLTDWVARTDENLNKEQLEDKLAEIMSNSMSHSYSPEDFELTADFTLNRVLLLRKQYPEV